GVRSQGQRRPAPPRAADCAGASGPLPACRSSYPDQSSAAFDLPMVLHLAARAPLVIPRIGCRGGGVLPVLVRSRLRTTNYGLRTFMNVISLIVRGDDFGLCHACNQAISEAFEAGLLTCASLVVVTP